MPGPKQQPTLHGNGKTADDFRDTSGGILDDVAGHGEAGSVLRASEGLVELVGL